MCIFLVKKWTEIGTTILMWKFDGKNRKIKINKSKNTQKNNKKLSKMTTGQNDWHLQKIAVN